MNCLVMKFGGASLSSPEHFSQVARLILNKKDDYDHLVVVVSAMANMTDQLIDLAKSIHSTPPQRELDMLVSIGERVSISLLSMALHQRGARAISFTGSQSGIITSSEHNQAKILDVRPFRIKERLKKGEIVIVAGFQGVSEQKEITTLGRGGSDTSAVALAVALGAKKVEFYKDVGCLYSSDPKSDCTAKPIQKISLLDALKQAKKNSSVLHPRCIELALNNGVPLAIHSYEGRGELGTLLLVEGDKANPKKTYESFTF